MQISTILNKCEDSWRRTERRVYAEENHVEQTMLLYFKRCAALVVARFAQSVVRQVVRNCYIPHQRDIQYTFWLYA